MKRGFFKFIRFLCPFIQYFLDAAFALCVSMLMVMQVMPVLVSVFLAYIGFAEDTPAVIVLLMGGIPLLFMGGLLLYGTIQLLRFGCRNINSYFAGISDKLTAKLDSK